MSDESRTITIPIDGWKTILYAMSIIVLGLVPMIYPEFHMQPEQLQLWFNQSQGLFISVIGFITLLLRHFTERKPWYRMDEARTQHYPQREKQPWTNMSYDGPNDPDVIPGAALPATYIPPVHNEHS